jgi:hypothetical protein
MQKRVASTHNPLLKVECDIENQENEGMYGLSSFQGILFWRELFALH